LPRMVATRGIVRPPSDRAARRNCEVPVHRTAARNHRSD
jgi:hypothetical protein